MVEGHQYLYKQAADWRPHCRKSKSVSQFITMDRKKTRQPDLTRTHRTGGTPPRCRIYIIIFFMMKVVDFCIFFVGIWSEGWMMRVVERMKVRDFSFLFCRFYLGYLSYILLPLWMNVLENVQLYLSYKSLLVLSKFSPTLFKTYNKIT